MLSRYSMNSKGPRRGQKSLRKRRIRRYSEGRLVLSSYALSISLLIFLLVLGSMYLFLVNARTTKGFEIKNLEDSISSLQKQQVALEQKAGDLQSINTLQQTGVLPEMITTTEVEYLESGNVAVESPSQLP